MLVAGAFPALLHFPKLHQSVAIILNDPYLLPGHKSLYNYALDLKNLYKSRNTKAIKGSYSHANCDLNVLSSAVIIAQLCIQQCA